MLAVAYGFAANRFADCLAVADRVLEVAEHQDLTETLAQTLMTKGDGAGQPRPGSRGNWNHSRRRRLARDAGLTAIQIRGILSRTYWELESDTVRALEGMREGLAIAQRVGDRRLVLRLSNNIGFSEFIVGQWEDGLATLEYLLREDLDWSSRVDLGGNALVIRACRGEPLTEELAELERLVREAQDSFAEGQPAGRARPQGAGGWEAGGRALRVAQDDRTRSRRGAELLLPDSAGGAVGS